MNNLWPIKKREKERDRLICNQTIIEMEQYPNKPITQKEWIKGYKKWKKEMKERDE